MQVSSSSATTRVEVINIEGLDLESMLMAVQINRTNLIDEQIKDQMKAVQDRNNRISQLNSCMNDMNAVLLKAGAGATEKVAQQDFANAAPKVVDTDAMKKRDEELGVNRLNELSHKFDSYAEQNKEISDADATDFTKDALEAFTKYGIDLPPELERFKADFAAMDAASKELRNADQELESAKKAQKEVSNSWTKNSVSDDYLKQSQAAYNTRRTAETRQAAAKKQFDLISRNVTQAEFTAALNGCSKASKAIQATQEILMKTDPDAQKDPMTRADAEAYIQTIKSQIDALGNTQQMDMLRLQSLSNKRNEAFELMSNFMKKLSDGRSQILQKI